MQPKLVERRTQTFYYVIMIFSNKQVWNTENSKIIKEQIQSQIEINRKVNARNNSKR